MQADVENGYRYSDEYRAGGESGEVVVGVGVYHVVKADGEGLFLRAGEYHAREDEVHPRGYELRERYEDENGLHERQHYLREDAQVGGPVELCRLVETARDVGEVALDEPGVVGHLPGGVGEDEAEVRVQEVQLPEYVVGGHHAHEAGEHLQYEYRQQPRPLALEAEAGEHIGGHGREHDGDGHVYEGYLQRVGVPVDELCLLD